MPHLPQIRKYQVKVYHQLDRNRQEVHSRKQGTETGYPLDGEIQEFFGRHHADVHHHQHRKSHGRQEMQQDGIAETVVGIETPVRQKQHERHQRKIDRIGNGSRHQSNVNPPEVIAYIIYIVRKRRSENNQCRIIALPLASGGNAEHQSQSYQQNDSKRVNQQYECIVSHELANYTNESVAQSLVL